MPRSSLPFASTDRTKIYPQFKGRVLVAEDNVINQRVAKDMLSKYGLSIDLVANGREAVTACAMFPYNLIFMDCLMPELDGFQATQAIRTLKKNANHQTPIVAMTANAMVGDRANCITAGMNDYLSKPIDSNLLEKCLHLWLSQIDFPTVAHSIIPLEIDQASLGKLQEMEAAGDTNLLKDLVEMFLKSGSTNILKLEAAVKSREYKEIVYTSHTMKSSCATLGLLKLSSLFNLLEESGRKQDPAPLDTLVGQITGIYPGAEAALQRLLK